METAPMSITKKESNTKELGLMECVTVTGSFVIKTALSTKVIGKRV
jgi:hypothetical protein